MPRPLRLLRANTIYHVVNRAQAHAPLFETREDVARCWSILGWCTREGWIRVLCVCCMGTHIHLIVLTTDVPLDHFMKRLQQTYAVYYNRTRQHEGHVFKDRYFSRPIYDDIDLAITTDYVDWNPVTAEMVASPLQYPHGSAVAYCGTQGMSWLHRDRLEGLACRLARHDRYRNDDYARIWAYAGRAHARDLVDRTLARKGADLAAMAVLVRAGPPHVQRWLLEHTLREQGRSKLCLAVPGDQLLARLAEEAPPGSREAQAMQAGLLHTASGWSVSEIGRRLGVCTRTVSNLLALHGARLKGDGEYRGRAARAVSGAARELYGDLA